MDSKDAPGERGDDEAQNYAQPAAAGGGYEGGAEDQIELPLPALVAETCSAMLEAVAVINRIEAKQDAWKIEFLDQARRIAETTSHGVVTVGSTLTETQQREMVRRSFVAEVACVLRIPARTASQLIDDSAVLMSRLPATLAALREGDLTLRHARVMVDSVSTLDDETALVFEQAALPFSTTLTVSQFTQKARILRERIDADSITERKLKSARDRRVEFLPARDGMAWLNLYTTAPEATSLYNAVRDAALALQTKTETRTLTQLSADVCADALAAGLANADSGWLPAGGHNSQNSPTPTPASASAFSRIQPTVLVTVPALTLLGKSEQPGDLAGYGPIDPDTARELAGQSKTWYRLLTDPDSGAPLALGRTTYKPTKAMRDYLAIRDGTCRFKGCNRQAKHCDIDHTEAWEFGGPTDCDNLSHLCPEHHRLKHETTWQATQLPGGVIQWISPDGRTYITEPDMRLEPPPKRLEPPPGRPAGPEHPADPKDSATEGLSRNDPPSARPDDPPPF